MEKHLIRHGFAAPPSPTGEGLGIIQCAAFAEIPRIYLHLDEK